MKPQLPDRDNLPGPEESGNTDVSADSVRFAEFDSWMDRELDKLVARWISLAAPNAGRAGRKIFRLQPK